MDVRLFAAKRVNGAEKVSTAATSNYGIDATVLGDGIVHATGAGL